MVCPTTRRRNKILKFIGQCARARRIRAEFQSGFAERMCSWALIGQYGGGSWVTWLARNSFYDNYCYSFDYYSHIINAIFLLLLCDPTVIFIGCVFPEERKWSWERKREKSEGVKKGKKREKGRMYENDRDEVVWGWGKERKQERQKITLVKERYHDTRGRKREKDKTSWKEKRRRKGKEKKRKNSLVREWIQIVLKV